MLIGGIYQNSIFGLTLLDKPCDDHIVFNFHYYNPLVFTHQKAHWIDKMTDECEISYPGPTKEYYEKSLKFIGPDLAQAYENYPIDIVDRRFMEAEMAGRRRCRQENERPGVLWRVRRYRHGWRR